MYTQGSSAQTGPSSDRSDGYLVLGAQLHHGGHLGRARGAHHHLWRMHQVFCLIVAVVLQVLLGHQYVSIADRVAQTLDERTINSLKYHGAKVAA
jgi:hypothetical protein